MPDIIIFTLSILPGLAWLFFYLQEDEHPEPKQLLAIVFFAGILSAFLAFGGEVIFNRVVFGTPDLPDYNTLALPGAIIILLVYAFLEEIVKFGAAWLIIRHNPEFDEPVDAMIYMVVAALGFATLENLGALYSPEHLINPMLVFQTTSMRFVGATLLHTLTSALIGYYWAMDIRSFDTRRFLIYGITLSTALHALFNYLIITFGELSYALLFVIIIGFFILGDFEKLREKTV